MPKKSLKPFLDLCVSSLRRGHANLLCIVPNLSYVRRQGWANSVRIDTPRSLQLRLMGRIFVETIARARG